MKQIINLVKYVFVIVFVFSVAFIAPIALAVGSNGNEDTIGSGVSNGDEGNGTPNMGGGSNNDEGGNENGNQTPDSNPNNGNGGNESSGSRTIVQISNIQVAPVSSPITTTILERGKTYTIFWEASTRNTNTALALVPVSSGPNISIGTSANPSTMNKVNWTVPLYVNLGNYNLSFTDSGNRVTSAPGIYKIIASTSNRSSVNSSNNPSITSNISSQSTETSVLEGVETVDQTQTAAVGDVAGSFWKNKYVVWFLILLLIIGGVLAVQNRRNQNL